MSPLPAAPYPPFLDEAVDHARRLVLLLDALDARPRSHARTWLLGRVEELRCVTSAVTSDWLRGKSSTVDATRSLNTYIQTLHGGLAVHFGELAPACCVCSLVVTATPISFVPPQRSRPTIPVRDVQRTWDVDERDLIEATYVPSSQ